MDENGVKASAAPEDGVAAAAQDPLAALPPYLAVRILALAYMGTPPLELTEDDEPVPEWDSDRFVNNPLRTVVPLVCRRWRDLLQSVEARRLLWRRLHIVDSCVPKKFSAERFVRFWCAGDNRAGDLRELDCDLSPAFDDAVRLKALGSALASVLAAAPSLRSLRLSGKLPLDAIFSQLAPTLPSMQRVTSLYLANGTEDWGIHDVAASLTELHALQRLEIRFACDIETPGTGLLDAVCELTSLRHLSLHYPLRSALPPVGELPPGAAALTQLTTLQLRRVPLQHPSPPWLAALTSLQHLYWDPFLPADMVGAVPDALGTLTGLETLYLEMRPPLQVPASLTRLQRLLLAARGLAPAEGEGQRWEWLDAMPALCALRLQGAKLMRLPEQVQRLAGLTRLGLMCNDLTAEPESLPPGPWLEELQFLHLGNNCIHRFPPALRQASAMRMLHIAHQRSGRGSASLAANATQRLALTASDVSALLSQRDLRVLIMGMTQPQVRLGGRTQDFDWLQRVLRQRDARAGGSIRLTSNELAYSLEPLDVFKVPRLASGR